MNQEKITGGKERGLEFKTLRQAIDSLPIPLRDFVDDAYSLASHEHQGQNRIGGEMQQKHVERVALVCANHARTTGMSDADRADIMAAAILHDVVEDTSVTQEEIRIRFNENVARVVQSLSHDKLPDGTLDEHESPEIYLRRAAEAGSQSLFIRSSDRLDNISCWEQVPQSPQKVGMERARLNRDFVKSQFDDTRHALPLWREIDPENALLIEKALEEVRTLEPLSGVSGIAILDKALAGREGISFADFMRSSKGQEFLTTKKIVIAGAPQSGKSVMRELMKRAVRAIPNAPYPYFLTGAPDGEWAGFQESVKQDPDSARRMKTDYKTAIKEGGSMFTPSYVERIRTSVKNLSAPDSPLNFIDIGGKMSVENLAICEGANAAIILCGENATKVGAGIGSSEDTTKEEMDPRRWKEFFASLGIPIIGVVYSDYTGTEDSILGIDTTGALAGSSHYFERGELDIESRPAIKALAEYIVSGETEKQMYTRAAIDNLKVTSRTAQGVVDTSASLDKADKMLTGLSSEEVADRALANFTHVMERLYTDRSKTFSDASELRTYVESIAREINDGITKEDILIREGADSQKYPYTRVPDLLKAMEQFYGEFFERLSQNNDPKATAAWVEYRIDLTDHFFADGCGKTAKAISSWVLMRTKQSLPLYRNREEYYQHAPKTIRGKHPEEDERMFANWVTYYKSLF